LPPVDSACSRAVLRTPQRGTSPCRREERSTESKGDHLATSDCSKPPAIDKVGRAGRIARLS
jgi:hypothetical protein